VSGQSAGVGRPAAAGTVVSAGWWALRTTWEASPGLSLAFIVFAVLRSVAPAGIALVARGLINVVIHALAQGSRDATLLWPWLAAGLVFGAIEALVPIGGQYCRQRLADELNLAITPRVLRHASELDLATLDDPRNREIVDRAQHTAATTLTRFIIDLEMAVTGVLQVLFLAVILTRIEPLVLVVVAPLAIPYLLFEWRRKTREHARELARNTKRRWVRYFASTLTMREGLAEIRVLGVGTMLLDQFRAVMGKLADEERRILREGLTLGSIFALLTTVGLYAVFARVAVRVVHGALSVGDIAVFVAASGRLRSGLDRSITALGSLIEQTLGVVQLLEFLGLRSRVVVGQAPVRAPAPGELRIEDVWFTYPGGRAPVLAGVSLVVRPGEIVLLVGANGAGKTTLVNLIARLYDPDRGRILLDGTDLRSWPLADLRGRIALLSQAPVRFEATAADNIGFGDWPRGMDERGRIEAAAAATGTDEMIRRLPRGYETPLGMMFGEYELSGGQWRKMGLARALLRDSAVLLLDEPTVNVDAAGVEQLQAELRRLGENRAILLISHRAEFLRDADRVLLLEQGRITRVVTHDELPPPGEPDPDLSSVLGTEPAPGG
jgi:ATP-binding cassette subfamily B protein